MVFLPKDLYLASGTASLINNWVDPVYKFDSSSFYNWEQDNLPIYDLEDRDNYLFEMAGYPTSAVDGVMLTVSDTGIDNKKVFGTISDAVDALPNTIRFPIIIEVCTSGPLGGMHLEHKEFEGSGAGLEIINRGFAKVLAGSGTTASAFIYNINSAGSAVTQFDSLEVSNTMYQSKSLGVSCPVWNNNDNSVDWWNNYTRAFIQYPEWGDAGNTGSRTVTISSKFSDAAGDLLSKTGEIDIFNVEIYGDNSVSSDMVITRRSDDTNVQRERIRELYTSTSRVTGFIYANSLSGVSVKGCSGKLFIRGFCVDGASQASLASTGSQVADLGFDIQNSEVLIENCTAARCKSAGLRAVESNVTLNRGFIAFHNYELKTLGANLDTKVESNPTPGLCAINSNITLSASTEADKGLPIDSPFNFYRNMVGIELKNSTLMTPSNTKYGTNIAGQTAELTPQFGSQTIALQGCFNIREGISAKDSLIDTGHRIASFQNNVGLKLNTSICKVAELTLDHNKEAGLKSVNSELTYNKDTYTPYTTGPWYPVTNFTANGQHILLTGSKFVPAYADDMPAKYSRFALSGNFAVNKLTSGGYNYMSTLPGVEVDNNSYMNAVCVKSIVLGADVDADTSYRADNAIKGSAFRVTNSSNLDLYGTGANSTWVIGPQLWSEQQQNAALYAGKSSHISIAGPTTICQFGVDALAEDNSTIEIGPHQKNGVIDASSWALSGANPSNHTQVQLHATRACLVANKNSTLNLHDLGDYHYNWAPKYIGDGSVNTPDYPTGVTQLAYDTSAFTVSGWCQFLPNPYVNYGTYNCIPQAKYPTTRTTPVTTATLNSLYPNGLFPQTDETGTAETSVSGASFGGMCVRAVNDSQVNVKNVLFPAGWENPSGAYYDFSSVIVPSRSKHCDLLRIWNIADDSELHASYLSVGSEQRTGGPLHPQDASSYYYGPSALWVSSLTTLGLSGAPSSTADTSNASILDSFGLGVQTGGELGYYGKTTQQNIGPFRIYVSPDPKAKFLGYPKTSPTGGFYAGGSPTGYGTTAFRSMGFQMDDTATLIRGAPYQLFAQGYATSSDCSATNNQGPNYTNASAIYQDLGFSGYIETLPANQQTFNCASSFYYVSAMISGDPKARIWLDESAMNTFANAKNGTLGTSGRKKIFSYYKAITEYPGEAFTGEIADAGLGLGFGTANLFDLDREL